MVSVWYDHVLLTIKENNLRIKKLLKYFYFTLLNFNYTDLNIQTADKLTIKIDKKIKNSQDLNNKVSLCSVACPARQTQGAA